MSDQQPASAFLFDTAGPTAGTPPAGTADGDLAELDRMRLAAEAASLTAYHWVIETDIITWSANAADILGCDPRAIGTGRGFAALLDPENFTSRYDTVMRGSSVDEGAGVPFQIEYKFRPEGRLGRASLWLEDHGKWYGSTDGRPVEVFGMVRRIDARHQRDQHLSFLGNCDPLTGMMNRGRLTEALGEAMTVAERDNTSCAFVIAAINNLSVVNEAYGFEVADEVVINMGRRLRQVVRTGDAIARYSGSKFGLILNNCDEENLTIAAERFLSVARESVIETQCGPVWALLSIGALILPKHAADANTATARAEEALTEARRQPTDGYVIYRPSQQRSSERNLNAHSAAEIVRCLRENRFRLAYQPVVDGRTGEPVFHEALLRMMDSTGEMIAAAHLIPIAEKLGLVRLIDRAVVQMAVAVLNKYPDARLSLNVSGTTATDPRWYPQITEMLASNRPVTGRLIIEITETVALGDLRETIRFVEQLRELGCHVAIDDFGAGYTSFRNLRAMPVDILKLDGTFCSDLSGNTDNQYFVRSLIDLARTFGMKTVAEWVETEADADLLRQWDIDLMQGNLFGEASLEPPWSAPAETIGTDAEMPFVLPSEINWYEAETLSAAVVEAPDMVSLEPPEPALEDESDLGLDAAADESETGVPLPAGPPAAAQQSAVSEVDEPLPFTDSETGAAVDEMAAESAADTEAAMATVETFETSLQPEIDKLRQAIAALDASFRQTPEPAPAEPSFADLVSDSARRAAG